MHLSPRELDKLIIHQAGFVAQKRYARGLLLNYPESVALIAMQLLEFIRDGDSVADLMTKGKKILGLSDVIPGVASMVEEVQVEGTFPDGTKLVTVHQPICNEVGMPEMALYGSGLSGTTEVRTDHAGSAEDPGAVYAAPGEITLNDERDAISLDVVNLGDRPVQVGSHFPFFEANPMLKFDRAKSYGFRLDIPSGSAVRFEPGQIRSVKLVAIGGERRVFGANGLSNGAINDSNRTSAVARGKEQGFQFDS